MAQPSLRELRLRLRAEEVRAVAGAMTAEENRLVLDRIAAEYERLAQCAELIRDSRRRLAEIDRSSAAAFAPANSSSPQEVRESIVAYRDMAADAVALADLAIPAVRERWCGLASLWTKLADDLERRGVKSSAPQEALN